MGATVTAIDHFSFHYGTLANNYSGVGFSYDDSGVQYPDHWGINLRVTIKTDASGASRVTIGGLRRAYGYNGPLRLLVDQSAESHCKGGTADGVTLGEDGSGCVDVKLSPNTVYYVWIVNNNAWPYYSHYYSDAGLTVTASGSYGAPATPGAADGTFGRGVPITLTGSSAGAVYRVTASCAGREELLLDNGTATSLVWTPAVAVYAPLLPAAGSAQATITCETRFGSALVGTKSCAVTLRFAAGSLAPVLSDGWATAAALNTGAAAGFTGYVQGYSRAQVSFSEGKIACRYGAAVTGCAISCRGTTVSAAPYNTPVLPGTTAEIVCTVTDSRGQTASETLTVTLLPYARPSLTRVEVLRCDALGAADTDGAYIACLAAAAYSPLDGENSCALRASVRALEGSFGQAEALTAGQRSVLGPFSPDTACEVRVTATDALGNTAEALRRLPTRRWALRFRPDGGGAAFGKAAESDGALELANGWALLLRKANGDAVRLTAEQLERLLGG